MDPVIGLAAAAASEVATSVVSTSGVALPSAITSAVPSILANVLPSAITTTAPLSTTMVQVAPALEVASAFAGALAGGLVAVRREFDFVGVATLAVAAGLGGGIIRDVLLQKYGIYALENPRLLIAALVAAVIAFFFYSAAHQLKWVLFLVDAAALGLFAAIGTDKALLAGLAFVPAVLLGTITAVGGGLIRDVLVNEVPLVLRPGGYYATAAVAGSVLYVILAGWLNIVKPVAVIACILIVMVLRLLSDRFGWQSPTPTDLTPVVAAVPRLAIRTGGRVVARAARPLLRKRARTPDRDSADASSDTTHDPPA